MKNSTDANPAVQSPGSKLQRIALYFFAIVTVVLFIWIIVSGMITDGRHSTAMQEQQQKSDSRLDLRTRSMLRATAAALLPGITAALASNDKEQLRLHVQSFSTHENLNLLMVADANGEVRASTDSRLAVSRLPGSIQLVAASASAMIVDTTGRDSYRLIAPVSGGGKRLGSVIMEFDFSRD